MSRDQTINRLTKIYSVNIKLTITVYDNPPRQQELHVTEIPVFSGCQSGEGYRGDNERDYLHENVYTKRQ